MSKLKEKSTLLVVDDEKDMLDTYKSILSKKYSIIAAASGAEALEKLKNEDIALILLDIKMPKMDGLEVLKEINKINPGIETIIVSALQEIKTAVEAIKLGAYDYIAKPFDVDELFATINRALEKRELLQENLSLKQLIEESSTYCDLIGKTGIMKRVFETIENIAKTDSTVLIHGESGTGKELVARAIHKKSKRANKNFVAINCAAIPDNLFESELFGYERGAFTGAMERKLGKFELADNGTLFLDEIGCMSPAMQAKLLRVLEEQSIDRVGGQKPVPINIRIISATNIDFEKMIKENKFREDLFYRLNVIPIELPPLRERKEDIALFISYFIDKFNKIINKKVKGFSKEAMDALLNYSWPGNVRELQNMMERVVALSKGNIIEVQDLPIKS